MFGLLRILHAATVPIEPEDLAEWTTLMPAADALRTSTALASHAAHRDQGEVNPVRGAFIRATGARAASASARCTSVIVLLLLTASNAAAVPARVVSINLCADALLAELLPRERIASVTHLGVDPRYSPRARALAGLPVNRGGADEVLALRPDLVIAGRFGAGATVALLRRLGVALVTIELPHSLRAARAQILDLARVLGVTGRGRALVAQLDRRLDRSAAPPSSKRPLAVLLRPNAFTAGPRTLAGELLRHAGFENLAERFGIERWGQIGLERLLLSRPRLLIVEGAAGSARSVAAAIIAHPAMASRDFGAMRVDLPANLLGCPGPWLADGADRLAAARRALQ